MVDAEHICLLGKDGRRGASKSLDCEIANSLTEFALSLFSISEGLS